MLIPRTRSRLIDCACEKLNLGSTKPATSPAFLFLEDGRMIGLTIEGVLITSNLQAWTARYVGYHYKTTTELFQLYSGGSGRYLVIFSEGNIAEEFERTNDPNLDDYLTIYGKNNDLSVFDLDEDREREVELKLVLV